MTLNIENVKKVYYFTNICKRKLHKVPYHTWDNYTSHFKMPKKALDKVMKVQEKT